MSRWFSGRSLAGKKGRCPHCKVKLQLMVSGQVPAHGWGDNCPGTGKAPQGDR